ncbi:hypothetical protein A2686_03645 [Candidatus Woesebacteria bacterium RIFCSPHIGHO2_01_FULL_38_10]|uniref:Phenylalanine ammonia-lyase n=1 Tax=Candidatus Woesebacteria bacterium RIFCSPLOWO2_01_FULL_39_10b TaxID=1802517 RepID=A0A1F8B7H2_9BACT|nr:MAG: hypothetical protein A2686_03645 [Candidatus Woesebacteria bacterium RIFCSPHIGHO2_01_FULL_38_10]OGM59649.1 MAG: hypothetical protein A2892_03940 [Candidatus Woesebacteria bacterium RIFCSPLOWO2_01_FULL_39_10b]
MGMYAKLRSNLEEFLGTPSIININVGINIKLSQIYFVARKNLQVQLNISKQREEKIKVIFENMANQVRSGIPIYGTTTAYGARAGLILNRGKESVRWKNACRLSEAIIHVDVSTGPIIAKDIVRAAMLVRLTALLSGHSAIRLQTIKAIQKLLNNYITPIVGWYGSVGASGDLAQNGRIVATLLQKKTAKVWDKDGKVVSASFALKKSGMKPIQLAPKEGLALVNGDNFSTAAATLISIDLYKLMFINTFVSALTIQALKATTRNFHPLLQTLRPHPGQKLAADLLRKLLEGSKLSFGSLEFLTKREGSIQDVYSIRCLPQFYGPDWETLFVVMDTLEINANSVSDNPLWTDLKTTYKDKTPYQWVSGGNFLAMYMSDALDKLRKIFVHIVKQNDRHMARLTHPAFNNGLPPNLSHQSAISQTTFKGLQTQMGMYEVFASLLATPVSTAFGVHEEFNQDITSHALTSALLTQEVLAIAKLAVASGLISACQAIDFRGGINLISPATREIFRWLRKRVPFIKKEQSLGFYVEKIADEILSDDLLKICLKVL